MREITFHSGGFPLTTDTLEFLQNSRKDVLAAWLRQMNLATGVDYIIAGCVETGGTISDGWMVIDGELIQLTGGSGAYVQVLTDNTSVTYEDTNSKLTYVWKRAVITATVGSNIPFADFVRLSHHVVIVRADCTHLDSRTYEYQLQKRTTSIQLDNEGDLVTNGGFILNRILPFDGIEHGHELLVRLGNGTGLTYLTKDSKASNILFQNSLSTNSGDALARPRFDGSHFIGSRENARLFWNGERYDENLHLKLQWHSGYQKWVELARFTLTQGSI